MEVDWETKGIGTTRRDKDVKLVKKDMYFHTYTIFFIGSCADLAANRKIMALMI